MPLRITGYPSLMLPYSSLSNLDKMGIVEIMFSAKCSEIINNILGAIRRGYDKGLPAIGIDFRGVYASSHGLPVLFNGFRGRFHTEMRLSNLLTFFGGRFLAKTVFIAKHSLAHLSPCFSSMFPALSLRNGFRR